jgi:hypothetical protein
MIALWAVGSSHRADENSLQHTGVRRAAPSGTAGHSRATTEVAPGLAVLSLSAELRRSAPALLPAASVARRRTVARRPVGGYPCDRSEERRRDSRQHQERHPRAVERARRGLSVPVSAARDRARPPRRRPLDPSALARRGAPRSRHGSSKVSEGSIRAELNFRRSCGWFGAVRKDMDDGFARPAEDFAACLADPEPSQWMHCIRAALDEQTTVCAHNESLSTGS